MALRENLLRLMHTKTRPIMGRLGFRPSTLTIVTRTWTGEPGDPDGAADDATLAISPTPKLRELTSKEVAASGGAYEMGMIRVGPITPYYAGPPAGGYTEEQLNPSHSDSTYPRETEILYVIDGPRAGEYKLVDFQKARGGASELGYELTLARSNRTP